jgi:hypothetical protein
VTAFSKPKSPWIRRRGTTERRIGHPADAPRRELKIDVKPLIEKKKWRMTQGLCRSAAMVSPCR